MKKIIPIIIGILVLIVAGFGAYKYHLKTVADYKTQLAKEAEDSQNQEELLQKRIDMIQAKLDSSEEEKKSLLTKIDELLTEEEYVFDSGVIDEEIKKIGELATVEYRYTNVGTLDATKKLFKTDFTIPGSKKTVIITMDGVIKVGIDVDKIKITSDEEKKIIKVSLPKAKIISNELDEDSMKVYDESSGLFNKITMEDSSSLRSQIKEKSEQNASDNGVYGQALDNAENVIRYMLEAIPGLKATYIIEFD